MFRKSCCAADIDGSWATFLSVLLTIRTLGIFLSGVYGNMDLSKDESGQYGPALVKKVF